MEKSSEPPALFLLHRSDQQLKSQLASQLHLHGRSQSGTSHGTIWHQIPLGAIALSADISRPDDAAGLVLFAHGSGRSRRSARNRFVAEVLNEGGIGTILMDLLTEEEECRLRDLNRAAMAQLPGTTEQEPEIARGTSHVFEEPGALEQVAEPARNWFQEHLGQFSR